MGTNMNTITEIELIDYIKNGVIKHISIVQLENGSYRTNVTLTWKKGEWTIITTRGKPRDWVSLDRLASHIAKKYEGKKPPISLTLFK